VEYVKTYELTTNGRPVELPIEYTIVRETLDGKILVSGPRYTASRLISLPNVLAVHESDDYIIDIANTQARVQPGQTLTKRDQSGKFFRPVTVVIGAGIVYFMWRYLKRGQ